MNNSIRGEFCIYRPDWWWYGIKGTETSYSTGAGLG